MLKTSCFILLIISYSLCYAQEDSLAQHPGLQYNLKFSYLSSMIYPGAGSGIEFHVKNSDPKRAGTQTLSESVIKDRLISTDLNWYHHPAFHDNIYLTVEWIMRRTNPGGFISEFSAGPGFSRTFLAGTTYRVNDNGSVSVIKGAGYNYALITFGGGFGYDFSVTKYMPFTVIGKLNILSIFPYNSTVYFRPVLDLGIRFSPALIMRRPFKQMQVPK